MNDQSAAPRAYVLEDDPDIAALEADLLREMGFSVVTCTRIVELGDLMDVALPHLMVVDVMLPDGDGGDITRAPANRLARDPRDLRLGGQSASGWRSWRPSARSSRSPSTSMRSGPRSRKRWRGPASCAPRRDRGGARPGGAVHPDRGR